MTSIIHDIPASAGPMLAAGAVLLPTTAGLRLDGTTLEIWSDDAPIEAIEYALHVAQEVWASHKAAALAQREALLRAIQKEQRARTPKSRAHAAGMRASENQEYDRLNTQIDAIELRMDALRRSAADRATWAYSATGEPLTQAQALALPEGVEWFTYDPTRAVYKRHDAMQVGDVIAHAGQPRVEIVALDVGCEPDRFGRTMQAHRGRMLDGPTPGREGPMVFGPDGEAPVETNPECT